MFGCRVLAATPIKSTLLPKTKSWFHEVPDRKKGNKKPPVGGKSQNKRKLPPTPGGTLPVKLHGCLHKLIFSYFKFDLSNAEWLNVFVLRD